MLCGCGPESTHLWDWPQWTFWRCVPAYLTGRLDLSSRTCMCASWCAIGVGDVARSRVSSRILEASLLPRIEEEGRLRLYLWTPRAEVLEQGLLSVPLAKVLPLSGAGFLCEEPALHLSPSPSKPQVCRPVSGWLRGSRLWPSCGWVKGGVLLGQPGVIRSESLGSGWGICSCGPDSQLWAWDLEELMCPHP